MSDEEFSGFKYFFNHSCNCFLSLIIYLRSCRAFWEKEKKLKTIGFFFDLCRVFLHSCSVKHWWLLILPYVSVNVFNLAGLLVLWDSTHSLVVFASQHLDACVKEFHTWLLNLEPFFGADFIVLKLQCN